jgi:glycosyltransferase involved in cell wall biosynthesis
VYAKRPIRRLSFILNNISKLVDGLIINNSQVVLVSGDLHARYIKTLSSKKRIIFLSPGHSALPEIPKKRGDYVFTVTAWKEGKELEELLKIIAMIKGTKLKIAGRWVHEDYKKNIINLINELKISDNVEIIGEISEEDLNKFYSKARVTVTVNNERGFGLATLEAASNGCPFIISEDSGAARYFKNNQDGFYFKHADINSLQKYIIQFMNDEKLAYKMGKHAWETVKNNYTWQKHAERLMAISKIYAK